jgi:diguanylate cyclase (GGDEF)-like protein
VAVSDAAITDPAELAAASAAAILIGLVCLIGYRRLPRRFFHLAAAAGIAIVTFAGFASEPGSEAVYAPFYGFIAMLTMLFFRPVPAVLQSALALAAYAFLLYERDAAFATHLLLSSLGMLAALGVLIAVVRTRTTRVAGELSVDAYVDPLTGIPNRRSFDERFALEIERARRRQGPLALVICDLDHFKRVNDRLGHEGGDEVLARAAGTIAEATRAVDLAARIGGEEFGVILPGADPHAAAVAAERLREHVMAEFAGHEPPVAASSGVASTIGAEADQRELFDAADRALYSAKRAGRNCTAIATAEGIRIVGGGSAIGRLRQSLGAS